jgi:signal transduction histidine kinase
MAEFARAFGHEMTNTLGAMTLQLEMLTQDVPRTGSAGESLGILETAAQQGIGLVRRVRDLGRLSRPFVPRPVDLCAAVDDALRRVRSQLDTRRGVALTVDHGAVPRVLGDADELALAVRELLTNALDAVGETGCVRIVTAVDGPFVACRVIDDGNGVTRHTRARAFEPFVSTRAERGRGLGLTIARAVAARHDGTVDLAPAPGRGAVATLSVPRLR